MYEPACTICLEGVVSKVRDSRYHSGRSNEWVKKTCAQCETPAKLLIFTPVVHLVDAVPGVTWPEPALCARLRSMD